MDFCFDFELTPEKRPLIIRAGLYKLRDRAYETVYCLEDFHALHLYPYSCRIRTAGHEYEIVPGDVTLTPAGVATTYALPEPGTHLCIHFELAPGSQLALPFHCPVAHVPKRTMEDLLEVVDAVRDGDRPENRTAAECQLLLLLYRLYQGMNQQNSVDSRTRQLLHHLDRHSEQLPDVPELARRLGVSQTHLTRRFKQHTGLTIAQYVMRRRIDKARYLLASSNMSIKEIGLAVGYATAQEFNKRFHQMAAQSPSAYRRAADRHAKAPTL